MQMLSLLCEGSFIILCLTWPILEAYYLIDNLLMFFLFTSGLVTFLEPIERIRICFWPVSFILLIMWPAVVVAVDRQESWAVLWQAVD
jgi:hypothetical protein